MLNFSSTTRSVMINSNVNTFQTLFLDINTWNGFRPNHIKSFLKWWSKINLDFRSEVKNIPDKFEEEKNIIFYWKPNVHEWVCGGKLLSVTLRHNERGKTLPYMGIHPTLLLPSYLPLHSSGLALYDAHIWRSYAQRQWGHFWKSKHSLGGSVCSRRAKNAIGLEPTIGGQLLGTPVDTF